MISNLRQTFNVVTLESCLQDVEARFLFNLPESELQQSDRLFFQIEQAWWFYEDFMADKYDYLPHFKTLKSFAETIFIHCPLLNKIHDKFDELFNDFGSYKNEIPVCGCILLSPDMTKIAIICTWNGKSWSFPRGKIDEGETSYQCAIRETFEETGYDALNNCREEDCLNSLSDNKLIRLFIATNVSEDTIFDPQTRKEVSKVEFHKIDALPNRTYGIIPFLPSLKRWIAKYTKAQQKLQKSPSRSNSNRNSIINTPNRSKSVNAVSAMNGAIIMVNSHKESRRQSPLPKPSKESRKQSPLSSNHLLTTTTTNSSSTNGGNNNYNNYSGNSNNSGNNNTNGNGTKRSNSNRNGGNGSNNSNNNSMSVAFDGRNSETFSDEEKKGWNVNAMFEANAKITGLKYEYDGNPHSFGNSHPRFVNYGYSNSSSSSNGGSRATSFDHTNIQNNGVSGSGGSSSGSSNIVAYASVSSNNGNNSSSIGSNENIVNNNSNNNSNNNINNNVIAATKMTPTRNLFNLPFIIDKTAVMSTVDFYLFNAGTSGSGGTVM